MVDTLTNNIRLTNQALGANEGTWGDICDANFEEIDDKFGDVTALATTGGTTTLSVSQEIVNAIHITGTLASNATIEFSGRGGAWIIKNGTSGSFTVRLKVTGQTGILIGQGGIAFVYCNGTDIALVQEVFAANPITVASASTCDVLGAPGHYVQVSGTTTITSFGTGPNRVRHVVATGNFKITFNGTSLIMPGALDLNVFTGDSFTIVSDASSNVRVTQFQRFSTLPAQYPLAGVTQFAGVGTPTGWLQCSGANVSRTTYSSLFAVIGTIYGAGDGLTTFTLPTISTTPATYIYAGV